MIGKIDDYMKDSLVSESVLIENLERLKTFKAFNRVFDSDDESPTAIEKMFRELSARKKILKKTFKKDSIAYNAISSALHYKEESAFDFVFQETGRSSNIPVNYIMYDKNARKLIGNNTLVIEWASDEIKNDKRMMLKLLSWEPSMYEHIRYVSPINMDVDICEMVLKSDGFNLGNMPPSIRKNMKLIKIALKNNIQSHHFIDKELKQDLIQNKEILIDFLKEKNLGYFYKEVQEDLKNDIEIIESAIIGNANVYEMLSDENKNNKSIVLCYVDNMIKEINDDPKCRDDFMRNIPEDLMTDELLLNIDEKLEMIKIEPSCNIVYDNYSCFLSNKNFCNAVKTIRENTSIKDNVEVYKKAMGELRKIDIMKTIDEKVEIKKTERKIKF